MKLRCGAIIREIACVAGAKKGKGRKDFRLARAWSAKEGSTFPPPFAQPKIPAFPFDEDGRGLLTQESFLVDINLLLVAVSCIYRPD